MNPRKLLLFLVMCVSLSAMAQTETFDITHYIPPANWKKEAKPGVVTYVTIKEPGGFCLLAVYASKKSKGNSEKDFESEWNNLVSSPFKVTSEPAKEKQETDEGWTALMGVASIDLEGVPAYVLLTTFTGFGRTTSILATLSDNSYLSPVDSFLSHISLDKEMAIAYNERADSLNDPTGNTGIGTTILGSWGKSSSSPTQYINGVLNNLAYTGYIKGQYDFKKDGSYTFRGEGMGASSNEYRLIEESGKYTVSGEQLTIKPGKSIIKVTDAKGVVKKTQQLPKEKRIYTWHLHYFEGIQENNLVLKASKENVIDGGFSSNELFPNSFLYSQQYKPEWRFK